MTEPRATAPRRFRNSFDVQWEIDRHVTYKPGWVITALPRWPGAVDDGFVIEMRHIELDSRGSGQRVEIVNRVMMPLGIGRDQLFDWLLFECVEAERHETREWFRVDGEIYDDPHQNG